MPEKSTRLGFAGFCKTDIMLYMARILVCLGESVAIVDQSGEQELRFSVPAGLYSEDRFDYRGVDIFLNCENLDTQQLPLVDYSVVLLDYGVNRKAFETLQQVKALFIVTDMQRHHAVPLSYVLGRLPVSPDAVRILRDVTPGKIRPRYIDSLLQAGQFTNLLARYELHFDEAEYAQRLISQYDDIFQFNRISEGYKGMLKECMTELMGYDRKAVEKAFKKAQRGG